MSASPFARIVVAALLAASVSCADTHEGYSPPEGVEIKRLVVSELLVESDIRGLTYDFNVKDSRMVVADVYADSAIVVFDTAGTVLRRLGPKGEGPGETGVVTDLEIRGDTAWIWDTGLSRLYSLDLTDPQADLVGRTLPAPGAGTVTAVHRVRSRFYGTGASRQGTFAEWSADSSTVQWKGEHSRLVRRLPKEQWLHVAYTFSAVEPDLGRLALGLHQTGEFMIVDLATAQTLSDQQIGSWPILTERITRGDMWKYRMTDEAIMGYYGASASSGHVAALFIGKPEAEADLENSYDARDVHVFDWNGELTEIYRLDRPVVDIALTEDRLYGLIVEPIPQIRVWRLPKVIQAPCF